MVQRPWKKNKWRRTLFFAVIETGCPPLLADIANPLPATQREERQRERAH
jgi:hypothetical protein